MDLIMLVTTLGDKVDSMFYAFDMWFFHLFGSIQCAFCTEVARFFTVFGDERFMFPFVALAVALCFFKKTRKLGFSLIFAIIIGTLVTNLVCKPMFLRIRPYNTLQANADYWGWYTGLGALSENDYSFPSGHTTGAFEIAVALGIYLCSIKKKGWSYVPLLLAVGTMCSRVYLMVHYASDVVGGAIVGVIAGVLGYCAAILICKLFEKVKFLDSIDLEKLCKNGINPRASIAAIMTVVVVFFLIAYIPSFSEGGDVPRCAYNEEYDCYNNARVDDEKYPAIDGKEYCKIHWKQLNGVAE